MSRSPRKNWSSREKQVFVDGTKLESRAGRYTFCWRKSVEKHLKTVRQKVVDMTGRKSLLGLKAYLEELKAGSSFVHGSGCRKSETQRQWEKLDELRCRWEEYEKSLESVLRLANCDLKSIS